MLRLGGPTPLLPSGCLLSGGTGRAQVSWDETPASIDVLLTFRSSAKTIRGKDLEVQITSRRLYVTQEDPGEEPVLAEGDLAGAVDVDGSFWWVDESNEVGSEGSAATAAHTQHCIRISLQKREAAIWSGVWKPEVEVSSRRR